MRVPIRTFSPPKPIDHLKRQKRRRKAAFEWYWQLGLLVVFGFLGWLATRFSRRVVLPFAWWVIADWLPSSIIAAWHDPPLILACLIGSMFIWSFPYEEAWEFLEKMAESSADSNDEGSPTYAPSNFRRGRPVSGPEAASYRAHQALLRSRRQRRQRRR